MHFLNLNNISDVMEVLNIKSKHPTKNVYFSNHTLFSRIYLSQEQRLNPGTYSKKKINMSYFIQAKEYDMNIHAKIQCIIMHGCLQIITSMFDLWKFYTRQ
jgi:hypothetical protein